MSAQSPLLQAVLDAPDALEPRLAYADALGGDPRGRLIRVQCELEGLVPADPRWPALANEERALFTKHRRTWLEPYGKGVPHASWRRGMIEHAALSLSRLPDPAALFEREPVTSVSTQELTRHDAGRLGGLAGLARVRSLRVSQSRLGAPGIAHLVTPRLARLAKLHLYQAGADDEAVAHLTATVAPQLEDLGLSGNPLSAQGVDALVCAPRLARLNALALGWLVPGPSGAARLASRLALPALASLDLSSNELSNAGLRTLAENPCFARLRRLRLEHDALVGAEAIEALAPLTSLDDLDLSTNAIGADGAAALAASGLPLRRLRLMQGRLGPAGVEALARGGFALEHLDLAYCDVDARGMAALATAPWPLRELNLWANPLGDEGLRALATSPATRTLRVLTLGFTKIGDAGIAALAQATWPALEELIFRGDAIGEAGARALAASEMPALRRVKLEHTQTPKAPLKPLQKRGVALEH